MRDIYLSYELDEDNTLFLTERARDEFLIELLDDLKADNDLPQHAYLDIDALITILQKRIEHE